MKCTPLFRPLSFPSAPPKVPPTVTHPAHPMQILEGKEKDSQRKLGGAGILQGPHPTELAHSFWFRLCLPGGIIISTDASKQHLLRPQPPFPPVQSPPTSPSAGESAQETCYAFEYLPARSEISLLRNTQCPTLPFPHPSESSASVPPCFPPVHNAVPSFTLSEVRADEGDTLLAPVSWASPKKAEAVFAEKAILQQNRVQWRGGRGGAGERGGRLAQERQRWSKAERQWRQEALRGGPPNLPQDTLRTNLARACVCVRTGEAARQTFGTST